MFVPAKRWGSPCLGDIFPAHPTVGSGSGKGHFLVRQFIIVYVCTCPKPNFVTGKRPVVSGSGFPTPLAFWVVFHGLSSSKYPTNSLIASAFLYLQSTR